jgi:hypothetical protein
LIPQPLERGYPVSLQELLQEKKDAIVQRWVEEVLATYSEDASALFQTERDPFANPLGHQVREGTRGVFEAVLSGMDAERIRQHLAEMVKIRAVQEFSPSQALSFVFALKSVIRKEVPSASRDPRYLEALSDMDSKIDQVALAAFDLFVEAREEVSQLRIREVKRQVAWVMEKINQSDSGRASGSPDQERTSSTSPNDRTEDLR